LENNLFTQKREKENTQRAFSRPNRGIKKSKQLAVNYRIINVVASTVHIGRGEWKRE
jgi:hypothetical protein